jgi:hypothetical protein
MGYASFIRRQVERAFRLTGDIAFDVTLQSRNVGSFNFTTQSVPTAASSSRVVRAIKVKEGSPEEVSGTLHMEILLSAENVPTPDIYDKAVINGDTWNIVPPYSSDGFLLTLKLAREA